MDKCLERHKVPKHTQEEIEIGLFRLSVKEIEFLVKTLPIKQLEGQITSVLNSTTHLRKK